MLTSVLYLALSVALVTAQALPPYEFETMYWGWTGPQNNTLTQCRLLTLQWWQIKGTTPPIKAPYTATFYLENYEPHVLDLGVGRPNGIYLEYDWMVDLPTGGPFQSNIVDANGATAGDNTYLYILGESPPVSACNPVNLTPSRLKMTTSNNLNQCATVNITVAGGTAPYTLNVVQQDIQPKVVKFSAGSFQYVIDNTAGRNVTFSVTDANGLGVTGPLFAVGQSTDVNCLTLAQSLNPLDPQLSTIYPGIAVASPTGAYTASSTGSAAGSTGSPTTSSSGTNKGTIIGAAVGAVALLILAALIGALWQRRRARQNQPRLDIGEAFHPTSATGITTTPFIPQDPYNNRDSAVSVPYSRGVSASYADTFPPIASPPYSPPATESVYTGSGSGSGGQRFSADSKTALMTGRSSTNPDPEAWRGGPGPSSPLPAGAARPQSAAMGIQDLEERAAQLGYELNPSRSPPPMYPVEKRNF